MHVVFVHTNTSKVRKSLLELEIKTTARSIKHLGSRLAKKDKVAALYRMERLKEIIINLLTHSVDLEVESNRCKSRDSQSC